VEWNAAAGASVCQALGDGAALWCDGTTVLDNDCDGLSIRPNHCTGHEYKLLIDSAFNALCPPKR